MKFRLITAPSQTIWFSNIVKTSKIIPPFTLLFLLFTFALTVFSQDLKGSWRGGINTKLTMRNGEMEFVADKKGLKKFSMETSFYFYDTQNYHECSIYAVRGDRRSKWTTKGNVTTIIDEDGNDTIVTKTRHGFVINSGCHNTQFYQVAFTRRGNRYVGREMKRH